MADGSEDDPVSLGGRYLWDIHRKYAVARIQCLQLVCANLWYIPSFFSNTCHMLQTVLTFLQNASYHIYITCLVTDFRIRRRRGCWWRSYVRERSVKCETTRYFSGDLGTSAAKYDLFLTLPRVFFVPKHNEPRVTVSSRYKRENRTPTKGLTHKEIQHICGLHTCILAFELDQFKTRRLCEEREVSPSACFPLLIGCFRKCPFSESQLVSLLLLHHFFMYKSLHLWLFFQLSYSSFVCIINVHRRPESALPITPRSLQEMNKTWPSGRRTQGTSPSSSQLYIIHSVHRTDSNSRTVQNKMSAWYLHANQGYVTLVVFYTIPTNVCEL